jgi:hypothetical protein
LLLDWQVYIFNYAKVLLHDSQIDSQKPPLADTNSEPETNEEHSSWHRMLFLYKLWWNLSQGSESRPALPTELVIMIFRLADCCVQIPSLNVSTLNDELFTARSHGPLVVRPWIHTVPITAPILKVLRPSTVRLEIDITSRDQGFANSMAASYSWFEIGLHKCQDGGQGTEPRVVLRDGKEMPLVWVIRHNEIATGKFKSETTVLDASHEVWRYLEEGDMLCLRVCAQYPAWANIVKNARFRFLKYFEPGGVTL